MRVAALITLAALLAGPAVAQEPHWSRILQREYVEVKEGQYHYDEYSLCSFEPKPGSAALAQRVQIQSVASAPVSVMTRDSFISLVAANEAVLILGMGSIGADYSCASLEKPIGEPDVTLAIEMTAESYQMRLADHRADHTSTRTTTWADAFPEP